MDAVKEVPVVVLAKEIFRVRLVAPVNRREKFEVKDDRAQAGSVFPSGITGRSRRIADIIMDQARLHGIEVDDASAAAGGFVNHHVAHLGVAVGGAQF